MSWLLNEDAGIKAKFAGLTVADGTNPNRPVAVRFRLPQNEFSDMTYPIVIIDHAGLSKADDREHRGSTYLPYLPEGVNAWWPDFTNQESSPYWVQEWPIPYNVDYQITVYSRSALQDRMLTAALAGSDRLPSRNGYVQIPQDGTIRRLDLIGGPELDSRKDADDKRTFTQVYTVRVSSELLQSQVEAVVNVLESGIALDVEYDTALSVA
jgi:hypothetical protein